MIAKNYFFIQSVQITNIHRYSIFRNVKEMNNSHKDWIVISSGFTL